jgi:hypothetical protein
MGFYCKNQHGIAKGLGEPWVTRINRPAQTEAVDELDLGLDSTSVNLPSPDHMHRLVVHQSSPGRLEREEPQPKRVYPNLLRYSEAIERLRQIRKPKTLQDHLGYANPFLMTLLYLSTFQEEDSLRSQ